MRKTSFPENITKDLVYLVPGYLFFLYLLFPFRFWEPFVFTNQIETIVITVFFTLTMLLSSLAKAHGTKFFSLNNIDLALAVYGVYILFRLKYPLEKESLFIVFSVICIYFYFRSFPKKYLTGLLFLIPIAGIIQIIHGVMQFSMPWHNISHIMGIFNNTGLFGGFAALGLVVCLGIIFFFDSEKKYLKYIVFAISVIFGIILAVQINASGSRASWLAALVAIIFLFLFHNANDAKNANLRKKYIAQDQNYKKSFPIYIRENLRFLRNSRSIRYFLILCSIIILVFFSKYLYNLKKDSADGRVLIGMVSLGMVNDAPLFGKGISGFRAEYMNYQADFFQKHPSSSYSIYVDDVETPFNEFLKILIEQGIIGLLLFCGLIYCLFEGGFLNGTLMTRIKRISADNNQRLSVSSASSAFHYVIILFILIFGLFSYPFDKLPFLVLFVFSIAIISQSANTVYSIRLKKMNCLRIPLVIVVCFVLGIIGYNDFSYAKSCLIWNQALKSFSQNKEESLSRLEKLYPKLENNPVFLTTYGKALGFGEHYHEATVVLEKAVLRLPQSTSYIELGKNYEGENSLLVAFDCWEKAGFMVPSRFTPLYLTMKLHFKNGEYEQAKKYAEIILKKKIKIDNPEIDKMKREALETFNL